MSEIAWRVCQLCNLWVRREHEICPNCDARMSWRRPETPPESVVLSRVFKINAMGFGVVALYVSYGFAAPMFEPAVTVVGATATGTVELALPLLAQAAQEAPVLIERAGQALQQLLQDVQTRLAR